MKKLISPKMQFLYILIFVSILTIYKYNNKNNIIYLSLGDAYAKGINSYGIEDYSYSDYLKDIFIKKNELKYYSKDFSKVDNSIKMLKSNIISNETYIKKDTIHLKEALREADIITLSIGINDLKYKILLEENINNKKLEKLIIEVEKEFTDLIIELKKYYKNDIYVVGYPINTEDYYLNKAIREYNKYLSNNKEIVYISPKILENNKNKYFLNPNSNYPSSDAYRLISKQIYKKYRKNLKKS